MNFIKNFNKKFLGNDASYFIKSGSWLAVAQIINVVASIALASFFARFLSQEDYGTYKYFVTLIGLFSVFSLGGMNATIARTVSRGAESNIYRGIQKKLTWSLIGSFFSLVTALYYFYRSNEYFGCVLLIITFFLPLLKSFSVSQPYLSGKKLFKQASLNASFLKITTTLFLIATLSLTQEIWTLILVYCASLSILTISVLLYTTKKHPPQDTAVERDMSDGYHLSFMTGLGIVTDSLRNLVLWHILGPVSLAVYAFAIAPVEQIRSFIKLAENIFMPKFSPDSWTVGSFRWFLKKTIPFTVIIIISIGLYILCAPYIYTLLFPQYLQSIPYSQVLAVGMLFTALSTITNAIFKAKKQVRNLYIVNFVSIGFDLILTIPAIYFFGIYGLVFTVIAKKLSLQIASLFLLFRS